MSGKPAKPAGSPDDRCWEGPSARTRHGELTLDEIGSLMPGLGTLMPVISDRYGWMVHAARGGNWPLDRYQLRKVQHLFQVGKLTRPKWVKVIDRYVQESLEPIMEAIRARDLEKFEAQVQDAVDEANRLHQEYNYGYIVYRVPDDPPQHMATSPPRDVP